MSFEEKLISDMKNLVRYREMIERRTKMAKGFQLPKLVSLISSGKIFDLSKDPVISVTGKELDSIVEDILQVNPFIFHRSEDEESKEVPKYDGYSDQPFDVVSIEVANNALSISRTTEYVDTYCIICVDKSVTDRYIISLADCSHDDTGEPNLTALLITPKSSYWDFFSDMREIYMQKLHEERHAKVESQHKWRIKGKSIKRKIDISHVVHVSSKNHSETITSINNKSVSWTHSWRCRGHWRKLSIDSKTQGKDRSGNRNQKGRTWVKESIKGSGVLAEKIRKVKT